MVNNKTYFLTVVSVENYGIVQTEMAEFDPSLEALQKQVGGLIEHYIIDDSLNQRHIDMWIDDEGKMKNLKPTFLLMHDGKTYDYIVGRCVFTTYDDEGNTYGLTDDDMRAVREFLYRIPCAEYTTRDGQKGFALVVEK